MEAPKIFESEYRFCLLLWEHEPINSTRLVALCREHLGWSKATTYTVIRRLSERGVIQNENTIVSSLISKEEAQSSRLEAMVEELSKVSSLNSGALTNIAPRLRMTTLYAIAAAENRLVAGTGNRSERHMGYFTKWGDGASDFNPISDLTATEVFEFLEYLNAPRCIIDKAPSAGLFDGQTDEAEMGVSYKAIDGFLLYGTVNECDKAIIDRYHSRSEHKRRPISTFENP